MRYGFIYETTNIINGMKYIGKHKRYQDMDDPDDSWYLGSGKLINHAIDKYGKENFSRKILCECEDELSLQEAERQYIEKYNAVESSEYYNLVKDANPPIGVNSGSFQKGHIPWNYENHLTEDNKRKMSESAKERLKDPSNHPMYNKHHKEESKRKMSESKRGMKFSDEVVSTRVETWRKNYPQEKNCIICGSIFLATGPRAKYCSSECYKKRR